MLDYTQKPKTNKCCGHKPLRGYYQTGFKRDDGKYVLECLKCKRKVIVENMWNGIGKCEIEAIVKWNQEVGNNENN